MENTLKLTTFFDLLGRTIIGEQVKDDDTFLYIKNPAVVNVVQQNDPNTSAVRMALQLFPLFFREFLAAPGEGTTWKFRKNNIVQTDGDLTFDFKLAIQYQQIFAAEMPAASQQQPQMPHMPTQNANNGEIIQLFDDDK